MALTYVVGYDVSEFDWKFHLPSFSPEELYSPILLEHKLLHTLDLESACKLQRFRDHIFSLTGGLGIVVNHGGHTRRGVRSMADQIEVLKQTEGAEILSPHLQGKAFDCSLSRWDTYSPKWLFEKAKEFGFGGIGLYSSAFFVHVDTRSNHDGSQTVWKKS